jgi:hypothetical protein
VLTISQIENLFRVSDASLTRCPVETYEIRNSDGTSVNTNDRLWSLLEMANRPDDNSDIDIQTNIALTDGRVVEQEFDFKIKATARGGNSISMSIEVIIVVCGSEVITLVDQATYSRSVVIAPNDVAFQLSSESFFQTSDVYCPPIYYNLYRTDLSSLSASE